MVKVRTPALLGTSWWTPQLVLASMPMASMVGSTSCLL
ncbi:hypothetical protein Ahy_B07g086166 isoform C [Arachis hypogaea]|uniref:Uncharacterized protein n=1 Tax=Arachis hypogaea TaxID=3818 RepID=A0A444Y934_ARAHY|nr:hypothetical protein Ahy_B07g086166 isoform C [Arachis hypogaea]